MDHDLAGSFDLEARSTLVEEVHMAFLESLDPDQMHRMEGHSRDHIEDSNSEIVVAVGAESVEENWVVGREADYDVEGLVRMAG